MDRITIMTLIIVMIMFMIMIMMMSMGMISESHKIMIRDWLCL